MFTKLIKYNLKPILKNLLPYIIALFVSVLIYTVTAYDIDDIKINASQFQQFLHGFGNFAFYCSLVILLATSVKTIWSQFKINFYSDRAYLTHTLPIKRDTLWCAQCCNILITFTCILIVIILNCLLLTTTRDGLQILESFGLINGCSHCFGDYYFIEPLSIPSYLAYIFVFLAEFIFLSLCGMAGIILGHRSGKKISLTSGFAIYLIGNITLIVIFRLISRFDPNITKILEGIPLRTPGDNIELNHIARALLYIGLFYTSYSIALYFINQKLLKHGINLD